MPAASASRCSSKPVIEFETRRLRLGEFGIQTRLVQPEEDQHDAPQPRGVGPDDDLLTAGRVAERSSSARAIGTSGAPAGRPASDSWSADGVTIGRSRQCDVVLSDPNISRNHAEIRPRGGAWCSAISDRRTASLLNGRRIEGPEVRQAWRSDRDRDLDDQVRIGVVGRMLEPVSVGLKFGFPRRLFCSCSGWRGAPCGICVAVAAGAGRRHTGPADATGSTQRFGLVDGQLGEEFEPRLLVERAAGIRVRAYDLNDGATLGRRRCRDPLEDPFASSRHARISRQGRAVVIEDLARPTAPT